jgi:hypothetical protein
LDAREALRIRFAERSGANYADLGASQRIDSSIVPLGLRPIFTDSPAVETAGYSQKSLWDNSSVPKGHGENSPAFQRWETEGKHIQS